MEDDLINYAYDNYKDKKSYRYNRTELRQQEKAKSKMVSRIYKYMTKEKTKMTEQNFAKGVNVKVVKTQYGEIIKLGINYEKVGDNPINEDGWINLDILTSKNGKKYAVVDDYKAKKGKSDGQIMKFDDSEQIPF